MEGVRVLEVAQFTFVPAAGAVLADWGADVIHVEHAVTGDAQRGLVKVLGLTPSPRDPPSSPSWKGPTGGSGVSGSPSSIPGRGSSCWSSPRPATCSSPTSSPEPAPSWA